MGRRSRVRKVLNAPKTIYSREKTCERILKSLGQNVTWSSSLFECLQWVDGCMQDGKHDIIS